MDLLQCGQDVPVGPGPSLAAGDAVIAGGDVITLVRGGAVGGMTSPGGGGGLSPKYDGGGAGLRADCSYGGGSPILFSIVASIIMTKYNLRDCFLISHQIFIEHSRLLIRISLQR